MRARVSAAVASLASLASLAVTSCSLVEAPPQPPFPLVIRVDSDPGRPLAGAVVVRNGKDGPTTGADGTASLTLAGQEGEQIDLLIRCPADYAQSPKPLTVSLHRGSKPPEYDWACPPIVRHLVVAVRADKGPNLPVVMFGKTIGKTDANGAFTGVFPLKPGDTLNLTLDTRGNQRLHPRSPTGSFTMKNQDDVVTFDQKFTLDAPAVASIPRGPRGPHRF